MTRFVHDRSRFPLGAIIVTAYVVLALLMGLAGGGLGARLFGSSLSPMSSASANAILSAIASGMMALTAIVFSLVFVAAQFSVTAYSPRLATLLSSKSFLGHALGIFAGTFVYALVALRTVDIVGGAGIDVYIVGFAFLWLAASIAVLVLMLPRIRGLSIEKVLAGLHDRGTTTACRVYPTRDGRGSPAHAAPDGPVARTLVHADRPHYLVGLDTERLVRHARDIDAVISIPLAIGGVIVRGDVLATVHGGTGPIAERALRRAIWLADERYLANDPAYAIRLLTDIAVRALSPAINDPTTAVSVLDELDGLLRVLAGRDLEANTTRDEHGVVRLVRAVPSWDELVILALGEIHHYGCESSQVQQRLSALVAALRDVLPAERRPAIEHFAAWRERTLADAAAGRAPWIGGALGSSAR